MIPSRQLNSVKPVRVVKNYIELLLVVDQRKAWKKRKREVEKARKAPTLLMGDQMGERKTHKEGR